MVASFNYCFAQSEKECFNFFLDFVKLVESLSGLTFIIEEFAEVIEDFKLVIKVD